MSDYVASQKNIALTHDSDIEENRHPKLKKFNSPAPEKLLSGAVPTRYAPAGQAAAPPHFEISFDGKTVSGLWQEASMLSTPRSTLRRVPSIN